MVKKKTYLDIVKKNVSSHILENLWDEPISRMKEYYLNEGYTLEELEPKPRKFTINDVIRVSESFIIHPYSRTCIYQNIVYSINENGNMIRVPEYLYESYGISEDFVDGLKKVIDFGKDVAVGTFNFVKGINIMDIFSDPHTVMDLLSALLIGGGVITGAMTGGVSTLICTIAASIVDIGNIVWYLNDLEKEKNPVIRGGIYLGLAFSVVSMTFPIPNPQTITAEATKVAKLSGIEVFKAIGKPKNWLNQIIVPGRFPEGRMAELVKMIGAGAAGYEVFGELINGNLKKIGMLDEKETDTVYNFIGMLIGIYVMYKMGRILTILGKPFKAILEANATQKLFGILREFFGKIGNFMKTNGSNIFTKFLETIGIKKHIDEIIAKFSDSNFIKQFNSILEGIGKAFKKGTGDAPDLDTSIIDYGVNKNHIAGYWNNAQKTYSPEEFKKIVMDGADAIRNSPKQLSTQQYQTYFSTIEKRLNNGDKFKSDDFTKLLKEIENGKNLDDLVGKSKSSNLPTKSIGKVDDEIIEFSSKETGQEIITSIQKVEKTELSKYKFKKETLESNIIPTDREELYKLTTAIVGGDIKLSKEAAEEFYELVIKKVPFKKIDAKESKSFFKNVFTKKENKSFVFARQNGDIIELIPLSELKKYKSVYYITTDAIGGKIDNISARAFFLIFGRATGLNKAGGNKTDAAYVFDPVELGLTDVRGGKIISDDYNLFDKLKESEIVVDLMYLFQDMSWLLFPYIANAVQGKLETSTHTQSAMKIPKGLSNYELETSSIKPGVTFDSIPDPLKNVIRVSKALLTNLKDTYDISNKNINVDGAITPAYIAGLQELIVGFKKESGGNILIHPITKYKVNLNTILEDLNVLGAYLLSVEEFKKQYPDANV